MDNSSPAIRFSSQTNREQRAMAIHGSNKMTWFAFFFLFLAEPFLGEAQAPTPAPAPAPEPATVALVKDIAGETVRPGVEYYVVPAATEGGGVGPDGELGLVKGHGNDSCPSFVAPSQRGLPVRFFPPAIEMPLPGAVRESADLNVEFSAFTICARSTVWKLGFPDRTTLATPVTIGGARGLPGCSTFLNWFRIEKHGSDSYKFSFCPDVCRLSKILCKDVGIIEEDGKRILGLSDTPFPVKFKRAQLHIP